MIYLGEDEEEDICPDCEMFVDDCICDVDEDEDEDMA